MNITINGQPAALRQGTSFEFVQENRLFSGSDGYSLTIAFPLRGCRENTRIFGNINRADVMARRLVFDCEIRDGGFVKSGSITITGISDAEVKTQFLEGRTEANFDSTFDKKYINELDLGELGVENPQNISPTDAWAMGAYDLSCVALPWVKEDGVIENEVEFNGGSYTWKQNIGGLSWQPYLMLVVRRICGAMGYSCDLSEWEESEEHRYMLVCNTLPWAGEMDFAAALPHWTVQEFFEKMEPFLDAEFEIDHRSRHIAFRFLKNVLVALPTVQLERVVDEHSVDVAVEDGNCDYREAKNLLYAECAHSMWKFISCDWFIRAWRDSVAEYETLEELLAENKEFASWNGSAFRGSQMNALFYARDVDMHFVIRTVTKKLVRENKNSPNLYSYRCVLQPVNLFGGRVVDDREDADCEELEFVPAWVDFTDEDHGRCLFLPFSGFNADSASARPGLPGGVEGFKQQCDDWWAQPFAVQRLDNGEAQRRSEFYDKIYIGWWDGSMDGWGKFPYPFTEDVVISDDWSGYFRPHTSLRLNSFSRNAAREVLQVDTHQKTTFKFLTDTLPNPRSLFIIRGKRYVCEKITATFTENGMSQMVKGVFWPVIDEANR